VESDVDDAPLSVVSAAVNRAGPRPGDDAGSLHHDSMAHGASAGTPGCIGPSDDVPALGFPGAAGPGLARLLLSGSPNLLSLPIN
jgi:hypothetical protein